MSSSFPLSQNDFPEPRQSRPATDQARPTSGPDLAPATVTVFASPQSWIESDAVEATGFVRAGW